MQEHATDTGVFIRSMANRGHLGGLSWATPHALRVLDAAGFDVILVETVGVGRPRWRSPGTPTPPSCCPHPGWGTPSKPPRRVYWRSPTCSWSTRPTGTGPG